MTHSHDRKFSTVALAWLAWMVGPKLSAASGADQCSGSDGCVADLWQQPQQPLHSDDVDHTGLLQNKAYAGIVGGSQGVALAPTPGGRTVTVRPGKNYTCSAACGFVGGVPVDLGEAASPNASESCSCDIGPSPETAPRVMVAAPAETLFRNAPMLMTHDSATGYIGKMDPLNPATKTQWLGLLEQLKCGVRAFDMRIVAAYEDFRQLHYHHTNNGWGWKSDQTVADTVPELIDWSRAHPEELVVLVVSHCATAKGKVTVPVINREAKPRGWKEVSCTDDEVVNAFQNLGVKVQTSCDTLNTWTLDQASEFATMEEGGKMLMIPGEGSCVDGNYDDSVTSIDEVKPYVERTMASSPSSGKPFQVQSFIQQSGASVPVSAELNKDVYEWLSTSDLYDGVNFLEVNLACAYGTSISSALGATITPEDAETCIQSCETACKKEGACEQ